MEYRMLSLDYKDEILLVTISREEKMNALNLELISELTQVMQDAKTDEKVKGIIITGAGHKALSKARSRYLLQSTATRSVADVSWPWRATSA